MNTYQESFKNRKSFSDKTTTVYPQSIPPKFLAYINQFPSEHPLNKQFIPDLSELNTDQGLYDPIGDQIHAKGNGIIHRYQSRVLFTPTTICPIQCRYCFRKNELSNQDEILKSKTSELIKYIEQNPEINEVILTGGDPLIISNKKLDLLLNELSKVVPYIRFHTRTPIIMPERIDQGFIDLIQSYEEKFKVISLAIHTNHSSELYDEVLDKIKLLAKTKANLISQTVLLKEVNNDPKTLADLFQKLSENQIKPYYLHHPDKVKGAMHFYLPLKEGRQIYGILRDILPGWMIPHYVIDPSNGMGKTLAYNSESIDFNGKFIDRFNQAFYYKE